QPPTLSLHSALLPFTPPVQHPLAPRAEDHLFVALALVDALGRDAHAAALAGARADLDHGQRAAPQVRDDLLAARRAGRGRDPRGHLPGLPHARPAPAHQRAPAQRTGDPLPELPAHAILAG